MNLWGKFSGQFLFDLKAVAMNTFTVKVTERNVLSTFAFWPNRLLQPFIVCIKIMLRKICLTKTDCDEYISRSLSKLSIINRLCFKYLNDPIVLHEIMDFLMLVLKHIVHVKKIAKTIPELKRWFNIESMKFVKILSRTIGITIDNPADYVVENFSTAKLS